MFQNEEELAALIRDAAEAKTSLRIKGGGTRGHLGNSVEAEGDLDLSHYSGVTLYDPAALTLVVKAGTPLSEVKDLLAAENQMLSFEPTEQNGLNDAQGKSTIGGVVATNASGPRRISTGACRDALIGVRFVDGQGNIIKNGGRVMKNVTGYDLVKLAAGSFGSLGVLTELSFKTVPKPETSMTLIGALPSAELAQKLMSAALKTAFDVTAAAYFPQEQICALRLEGFESSVRYRAEALATALSEFANLDMAPESQIWGNLTKSQFARVDKSAAVWQAHVKPTNGPPLIERLSRKAHIEALSFDWAGGLITFEANPEVDIHALLEEGEGHAHCLLGAHRYFGPKHSMIETLEAGLRHKFDPSKILNPGIMG